MCKKAVRFVTLEGATVAEVEQKATDAVNEGGTVIGCAAILVGGAPIPAMVIISAVRPVAPAPDVDDDEEDSG
jgi:hypothetical protein